ncbi:MAG: hypothetical protein ACP5LJ_03755, partial [Candidatus Bipolaricaulaceae bacterium]
MPREEDSGAGKAEDFRHPAAKRKNNPPAGITPTYLVKEGMAGKVQMIYIDPPYGIKYASNFQTRINPRDVKNNREPDHSKVCLRQATHQMDNSDGGRYDHKTWVP